MKKYVLFLITAVISVSIFSQAPSAFSYQAVLRNSDGTIKADEAVALQIEILQGSIDGSSAYLEIHNTTTSALGLVILEIGSGTTSDDISTVDWSNGPYFLDITVNGTNLGVTQLLSVPYALRSNTSASTDYVDYSNISNVPLSFNPSIHQHTEDEISDLAHYTDADIDGTEAAFVGWDKTSSDDFNGNYNDLTNQPINISEFNNDMGYISSLPDSVFNQGTLTPIEVSYITNQPSCYGDSDGSILLNVTGGKPPYIFEWSDGSSESDLKEIEKGNYSVKITDQPGQIVNIEINLTQPEQMSLDFTVNNISCSGNSNGAILTKTTGGNWDYSWLWTTGENTQNLYNLSIGTYKLTATDKKGCYFTDSVSITEPEPLILSINTIANTRCFDESSGSVEYEIIGGKEPYATYWHVNGTAVNVDTGNMAPEEYILIIRDGNQCYVRDTFEIKNDNNQIIIDTTIQNVTCKDDNNGSIDLFVEGGVPTYSYLWNTGETTSSITGLSGGNYSIEITDNVGCTVLNDFVVKEPQTSLTVTSAETFEYKNESDGEISLTISGGIPGYSMLWSNGDTSTNIDQLSSGIYSYSISDENGCLVEDDIQVEKLENATDIDGNVYDIVRINSQIWMKENLKTLTFNDGWTITDIKYPNQNIDLKDTYGVLYPYSVSTNGNVCPTGWRVPSQSDFDDLIDYLKGTELAGGALKEIGTIYWDEPNTGATNQSGFSARGAGLVDRYNNNAVDFNRCAFFRTSGSSNFFLIGSSTSIYRGAAGLAEDYLSIRCIKD